MSNTKPTMRDEMEKRVAEYFGITDDHSLVSLREHVMLYTLVSARLELEIERRKGKGERGLREFVEWLAVSGYLTSTKTFAELVTAFLASKPLPQTDSKEGGR